MHERADRGAGAAEDLGDLVVRQVGPVAQDDCGALAFTEAAQRLQQRHPVCDVRAGDGLPSGFIGIGSAAMLGDGEDAPGGGDEVLGGTADCCPAAARGGVAGGVVAGGIVVGGAAAGPAAPTNGFVVGRLGVGGATAAGLFDSACFCWTIGGAGARPSSKRPSAISASRRFFAPATVKPSGPAPLTAKSLGFNTEATTYHLFDVTSTGGSEDPYALSVPKPLTPQPLSTTEFTLPGVAFGVERCFEVRPVDQIFGTPVIGPASTRTCVTPKDQFPPAAPRSLAAIAGSGAINLIWDANVEKDVAGYLVLRGEAPGDTLQAIIKEPIAAATFRDESVRPGVRYVYAVVAVDTAGNASGQSNRVEETAR